MEPPDESLNCELFRHWRAFLASISALHAIITPKSVIIRVVHLSVRVIYPPIRVREAVITLKGVIIRANYPPVRVVYALRRVLNASMRGPRFARLADLPARSRASTRPSGGLARSSGCFMWIFRVSYPPIRVAGLAHPLN